MVSRLSVLHERVLGCKVASLCPTMDLVAVGLRENGLSVFRTSVPWQKTLNISAEDLENRAISCIVWSPDGKTLALGDTSGGVRLISVETGAELGYTPSYHTAEVSTMAWVAQEEGEYGARDAKEDSISHLTTPIVSRCHCVLGQMPLPPEQDTGGRKSRQGGQAMSGPLNVFVSADRSGQVVVSLAGIFELVRFQVDGGLPQQVVFSRNLGVLSVLVCDGDTPSLPKQTMSVNLPQLWSRRHSLCQLTQQYGALEADLNHLEVAVKRAGQQWTAALKPLEDKLKVLCRLLAGHGEDASPRDALLNLVTCGHFSAALRQFFANDMTENHILKLSKSAESSTAAVETLLRNHVCLLSRAVHLRASELLCLLRAQSFYDKRDGIKGREGLDLEHACNDAFTKAEAVSRQVQLTRDRMASTITWFMEVARAQAADAQAGQDGIARAAPQLSLIKEMLVFLREPGTRRKGTEEVRDGASLEAILGTNVAAMLSSEEEVDPCWAKAPVQDPKGQNLPTFLPVDTTVQTSSLFHTLRKVRKLYDALLERPRRWLKVTDSAKHITALGTSFTVVSQHFRQGWDFREDSGRSKLVTAAARPGLLSVSVAQSCAVASIEGRASGGSEDYSSDGNDSEDEIGSNTSKGHTWAAQVSFPEGWTTCKQMAFYGTPPGVRMPNPELLLLLLARGSDHSGEDGGLLVMMPYDALAFTAAGGSSGGGLGGSGQIPMDDIEGCQYRSVPAHLVDAKLAISASRGTACLYAKSGRFFIIDIEGEPEDEEEAGDVDE